MVLGVYPIEGFDISDSLIVALIAIAIVFAALLVIIVISSLIQMGMKKVDSFSHIQPREENKILDEDEDAAVAAIVATIDFYKETKQNARLVSIKKIED